MSFTGLDVCIDVFCSAKIIIKFETANNLTYFFSKVPCFVPFSRETMFHSTQKSHFGTKLSKKSQRRRSSQKATAEAAATLSESTLWDMGIRAT